jgi:hypothetical protein
MQSSEVPCLRSAFTVNLEPTALALLERIAAQQLLTIEEYIQAAIQQALLRDQPRSVRKAKKANPEHPAVAPMDAFLPVGVDPFAPVEALPALASSFEEVQARMRFAGTPSLLRGLG